MAKDNQASLKTMKNKFKKYVETEQLADELEKFKASNATISGENADETEA